MIQLSKPIDKRESKEVGEEVNNVKKRARRGASPFSTD